MASNRFMLIDVINRLDTELDVQTGRLGLLQRWLDDQGRRLDALATSMDQTVARIDELLGHHRPRS